MCLPREVASEAPMSASHRVKRVASPRRPPTEHERRRVLQAVEDVRRPADPDVRPELACDEEAEGDGREHRVAVHLLRAPARGEVRRRAEDDGREQHARDETRRVLTRRVVGGEPLERDPQREGRHLHDEDRRAELSFERLPAVVQLRERFAPRGALRRLARRLRFRAFRANFFGHRAREPTTQKEGGGGGRTRSPHRFVRPKRRWLHANAGLTDPLDLVQRDGRL